MRESEEPKGVPGFFLGQLELRPALPEMVYEWEGGGRFEWENAEFTNLTFGHCT